MTRRRKLLLGSVLAGTLALGWVIPACRYPVLGVLRWEPFFQGMPASYWRDRIRQFAAYDDRKAWERKLGSPPPSVLAQLGDVLQEKLALKISSADAER